MTTDGDKAWAEQRREQALAHGERLAQAKAQETVRARALVAAFVERAQAAGVPTEQLVARDYSGRGPFRTDKRGWYVRTNRTAAVGDGGEFYVLVGGFDVSRVRRDGVGVLGRVSRRRRRGSRARRGTRLGRRHRVGGGA